MPHALSAARVAARHLEAISFTMPREGYLPPEVRGMDPVDPEGTDLAIWPYERGGKLFAIAFQGRSNKPVWHYRYQNDAARARAIKQAIDERKEVLARVEQARAEKARLKSEWSHNLKPGDILSSSWGYDQTNIDFYEVLRIVGKSVYIQEIASKIVRREVPYNYLMPEPGHFIGTPMRKIPQRSHDGGTYIKLNSFSSAYPWNGKPAAATMSEYGH